MPKWTSKLVREHLPEIIDRDELKLVTKFPKMTPVIKAAYGNLRDVVMEGAEPNVSKTKGVECRK